MGSAETLVILLRGINVGGKNKLPMVQLRDIADAIGLAGVQTYIQSGNLVASSTLATNSVASRLRAAIEAATGLDIPIVVRTTQQWRGVIDANPFADATDIGKTVHVTFLDAPAPDALVSFDASEFAPDELVVRKGECYLHLPNGMGRSKLAVKLQRLPGASAGTVRNWNTVLKLAELVDA